MSNSDSVPGSPGKLMKLNSIPGIGKKKKKKVEIISFVLQDKGIGVKSLSDLLKVTY